MKTDDLIAELAASPGPARTWRLRRDAVLAVSAGAAVALAAFLLVLGPRPDLAEALRVPFTLAKTLLPLSAGALALALSLRAARPAARPGLSGGLIWAVPALATILLVASFLTTASADRLTVFLGHSIAICLPAIVLLSLPVGGLLLVALRSGAPEHPARCGAFAGLAAAGLAAALYSTFCTEDQPLFYVVWYGLGMGLSTALGALVGARVLRW